MRAMVIFAMTTAALAGCSLKVNDKEVGRIGDGGNRAKDSYEYSVNGCETGRHEFNGTPEEVRRSICSALQNEGLNKGCAREFRVKAFEEKCPGQTFGARSFQPTARERAIGLLTTATGLTSDEREEAIEELTDLLED